MNQVKKLPKKIIKKKKVLFLCTGNSARSIMAEAILAESGKGRYLAYSAGSKPAGKVNPMATKVLEAHGIPTHKLYSKSWDEYIGKNFDVIVTVCSNADKETCPVFTGSFKKIHWNIADPGKTKRTPLTKLEDFYRTHRHLQTLIKAHFLS